MNDTELQKRYSRQILLHNFGIEKQQLLHSAKVLVIGAGGLGCPALQYLSAAGVGTLGIVDFDTVDISNLHRQILYTENDVGKSKAEIAAKKISSQNSDVNITIFDVKLSIQNALDIIKKFDLVLDGTDNFSTRYLVNDACALLGKPLVYGSVYRFEGQISVFHYGKNATNYRDIFPNPPSANEVPNCSEAGVLGVLPGIIGTMQANEAIKIITKIGQPLANKVLTFNSLTTSFYEIELTPTSLPFTNAPQTCEEFRQFNYDFFCNIENPEIVEISADELENLITKNEVQLIDVREEHEQPKLMKFPYISIPLNELPNRLNEIENNGTIIVFCQSGIRSRKAVELIKTSLKEMPVYSLKGGILELGKHKQGETK